MKSSALRPGLQAKALFLCELQHPFFPDCIKNIPYALLVVILKDFNGFSPADTIVSILFAENQTFLFEPSFPDGITDDGDGNEEGGLYPATCPQRLDCASGDCALAAGTLALAATGAFTSSAVSVAVSGTVVQDGAPSGGRTCSTTVAVWQG